MIMYDHWKASCGAGDMFNKICMFILTSLVGAVFNWLQFVLVLDYSRHFLSQLELNQNQSRLTRTRFPAFDTIYMYLFGDVIGQFTV